MLKKFGLKNAKPIKTPRTSKKQLALAISTTEAEYVSARKACQQALWMKQALVDYEVKLNDVLVLYDNKGAIDLSKNPVLHSRTKHIEIWKRIFEKRTKNQAKTEKTEHGMEKRGKDKVKSKPKSTKVKVQVNQSQPRQSHSQEVIKSKKIQL
ncbi:hypothetical protein Tco_1565242 [Tanacetum coccineum]